MGAGGYDRYAAMNNNPVRYVDPTGHMMSDGLGDGGGCDRQCWDERNPSPAPKPPRGGGGGSSGEECHGVLCSPDERNEQISDECDGSGLITQYCLDMDAKSAQELENFLDDANNVLLFQSLIELSAALVTSIAKLSAPQQVAIIIALMAVPPPVTVALAIIALESVLIGNDLNEVSESLSDSGVTNTGGRLTISSNILYDIYEVETPNGRVFTSYGFGSVTLGGPPISKSIIIAWSIFQ